MGSEVNLCHINSIFKVHHKLTYRIQISYPKKKGTHRIKLIQVCAFKYAMIIELFGRFPETCQPFWRLFVSKPLNIEFSEVKIKSNFDGEFPDIDGSTSFLRMIFHVKGSDIWRYFPNRWSTSRIQRDFCNTDKATPLTPMTPMGAPVRSPRYDQRNYLEFPSYLRHTHFLWYCWWFRVILHQLRLVE